MSGSAQNRKNRDEVAGQLRRLAGSAGNRRALNALPRFRLDARLPGEMEQLLARLDKAEASRER